jgi:hypothetical protein
MRGMLDSNVVVAPGAAIPGASPNLTFALRLESTRCSR